MHDVVNLLGLCSRMWLVSVLVAGLLVSSIWVHHHLLLRKFFGRLLRMVCCFVVREYWGCRCGALDV